MADRSEKLPGPVVSGEEGGGGPQAAILPYASTHKKAAGVRSRNVNIFKALNPGCENGMKSDVKKPHPFFRP
ncbi:hypothetical protein [Duganella caerulea]|uniref:hypothetical protein n=1 Tax=Duganella caerulea TaxID=2885762 RepID=UPI004037DB5E